MVLLSYHRIAIAPEVLRQVSPGQRREYTHEFKSGHPARVAYSDTARATGVEVIGHAFLARLARLG